MNIGAPWPDLSEAERRVRVIHRRSCTNGQRPILAVASMIYKTLSMTRRFSRLRGVGYGATRVHEPVE